MFSIFINGHTVEMLGYFTGRARLERIRTTAHPISSVLWLLRSLLSPYYVSFFPSSVFVRSASCRLANCAAAVQPDAWLAGASARKTGRAELFGRLRAAGGGAPIKRTWQAEAVELCGSESLAHGSDGPCPCRWRAGDLGDGDGNISVGSWRLTSDHAGLSPGHAGRQTPHQAANSLRAIRILNQS